MLKRVVATAMLVLPGVAFANFTANVETSPDNTKRTTNWAGDYDPGGGSGSWLTTAIGTGLLVDVTVSGNDLTGSCQNLGSDETDGRCLIYQVSDPAADIELIMELTGTSGASGGWEGAGPFIADTTTLDDNHHYNWLPTDQCSWRFKTNAGEPSSQGTIGQAGLCIGSFSVLQYDVSEGEVLAGDSSDGVSYTQIGSTFSDTMDDPYIYGFMIAAPAGGSTTTFQAVITESSSLTVSFSAPPATALCDPADWTTGCYNDTKTAAGAIAGGRTSAICSTESCIATNLVCGRDITLTATTFDAMTINANCSQSNPVILHGAANFGSEITGTITTGGAYNYLTGLKFTKAGDQLILGGTHTGVYGNEFTNYRRCIEVAKPGQFGEIAYNEFHTTGAFVGDGYQDRICIRTVDDSEADVQQDVWVQIGRASCRERVYAPV